MNTKSATPTARETRYRRGSELQGRDPLDTLVHEAVNDVILDAFLEIHTPRLESRIEQVCSELGQPIGSLESVMERALGTQGRGGRRWRPLLALAAAEVFGPQGRSPSDEAREHALDVAVAVELTHTASLVLDDMPCMDDSAERRGQPATHRLVGSAGAILLSVGLLAKSVELLGKNPEWGGDFSAEWGRVVGLAGMSGGQAMDIAASTKKLFGANRRLHRAKSTLLPAFALWSGARTSSAELGACDGLARFGRSLGWAYQLRDDAEDLDVDARLGKSPGGTRPMAQSRRIMIRALRGLRQVPGLSEEGADLLIGLSKRLVVPGALQFPNERVTTSVGGPF